MNSCEIIDINKLLEPLSEDNPVGSDLRNDPDPNSIYQQIKQARNSARADERHNLYDQDNNKAIVHWKNVAALAPKILTEYSKDVEIISWFIESQAKINGFKGLRNSFTLTKGLIEKYWDTIYPVPDDDGMHTRLGTYAGLNGEGKEGVLIAPIRNIAITEGDKATSFCLWQYQQSLEIQKIADSDTRSKNYLQNGYSMDDIELAVSKSSGIFYDNLRKELIECISEFSLLSKLFDKLCGIKDSPPSSKIKTVLEQCLAAINHLAKNKFSVVVDEKSYLDELSELTSSTDNNIEAISSREVAFNQLHNISAFFLKTEPHSPVSYLLAKAVDWGNLPLNKLIEELIPDKNSRQFFSTLTGIKINDDK